MDNGSSLLITPFESNIIYLEVNLDLVDKQMTFGYFSIYIRNR